MKWLFSEKKNIHIFPDEYILGKSIYYNNDGLVTIGTEVIYGSITCDNDTLYFVNIRIVTEI